ncbi:hypothetical protein OHB26_39645 (plasmid) [Nocardia sp. NBC_01503]|uniref:hypothetical protein n=1 Tax=Nocardia sp. NBC_01503 TaxID=2975997 RepID=UPI002E7AD91B|nr:hypothetical protein [Nocardia sp. NBC_01503]WTL36654.1 hypothetical protein OHB26_38930 [Nocardia sp. NBC_01503]WTL36793.1 hypothetical protein OHB26_39645 [Nocardia sp. NBC_01503]
MIAVLVSRWFRRSSSVLRFAFPVCAIGSVLLAVASPVISTDSMPMQFFSGTALIGLAVLCAAASILLWRTQRTE